MHINIKYSLLKGHSCKFFILSLFYSFLVPLQLSSFLFFCIIYAQKDKDETIT